jgi:hypothetical protein
MQYLPSPPAWNRIGTRLVILFSLQAIVFPAEAQISPEVVAPAKRIELTPAKTPAEVRPSTPLILKLGNLKTYRQPNNLFSIDVPETWQIENFSQPNRIKLQWQDPDRDALICIELVQVFRKFTQAELGEELTKILKRVYATYPRLRIDRFVKQPNGSVRVSWSYQNGGTESAPTYYSGNSFMQQYGNKLSGKYYILPSQQYDRLKDNWIQSINSYQVNESAEIP